MTSFCYTQFTARLHLAGYDDQTDDARGEMRARERHYLAQFGLMPRYKEPSLASGDD